jgi:hypothetical protein
MEEDSMSTTVEEPTAVQAPAPPEEKKDPATVTPKEMFRWSSWVHVGPGSDECEDVDEQKDGGVNECANPLHFHAWCRLPNQFQHREIREKAMAAKARKVRQLRDPDSDAYAVMEADLDALARQGDAAKPALLDEILGKDILRDYLEAANDVKEIEDDVQAEDAIEPALKYAHVEQDEIRLAELRAMPEDKRPKDEYEELGKHVAEFHEAVQKRLREVQQPRHDSLEAQDVNALVDLIRDNRIERDSMADFMHTYSAWSWLLGTLKQPRGARVWGSIEQMEEAAPEVIEALQVVYDDLEQTRNAAGN